MSKEREKHNYTGQTPSDKPSKELTNPPDKSNSRKKAAGPKKISTTAKMPNLGNRNDIGR
jgi:hypothetical protein